MLRRFLLITFLLLIVQCTWAQLQRRYINYNVDNGLAQNSVWDMHQDYRGFLWFGTADGINRFDGYEMQHYKKNLNDSNSINGITFFQFYETPNKELWVGHDKGISIYNRIKDNFNNIIKSKNKYSIIGVDSKNRIWAIEERLQIVIIDINTKKIVKQIKPDFLNFYANFTVSNAIKLGDNFIITYDGNSILKIDFINEKIQLVNFNDLDGIFSFMKKSENSFISFSSSLNSIIEFTIVGNSINTTKIKINNPIQIKNATGIYEWNNKLYISSLEGYYILNNKTYILEEYVKDFGQYESSFNYIQCLMKDQSNNLYFSTNGMGVKMYSLYLNKFKHLRTPKESYNMVKSILKTKDGKIITGVYNEGIVIYYPNNTYKQFNFEAAYNYNSSFRSVLSMINYSDNEILMMFCDRLILFNHKTNKLVPIKDISFEQFQYYPSIVKYQGLIYTYYNNKEKNVFVTIDQKFNVKELFTTYNKHVTCFDFFKNKMIIGTDRGLIIKDNITNKIISTKIDMMVKSICISSKNRIFVTSINGMFEINERGDVLNKYDVSTGLPADFIYAAIEDNNGDLWLSHNKGLTKLNIKDKSINNFSKNDGLQSNEFNTGAYHKDENGLLYFGGVNGINIINPDKIIKNKYVPKIAINEIYLNDEKYISDTSCNEIQQLDFEYNDNTISFDFSALEFTNPALNTYKYKLDGYDEHWINSGTKHFARYSNLPAGNYTFMILAANADGDWLRNPKKIYLQIHAPFWESYWFYSLITLLAIALIVGIIYVFTYRQKSKLNRKLKSQHDLEQERLRIARDLHDNVGAHLSYLISNLDWMISHPEKLSADEEKKHLENLTEAGRQAILTLRQTIWAINNQTLLVEDFADKYKAFAKKMLDFSMHIHINFEEEIIGKEKLSPGITLHLFRICQEALSNILKHAQAKNINVNFKSNAEYLFYFSIIDDGKGFDTNIDYSNEHFGLVIMKERAEECGAVIQIKSSIGKGTELSIHIKNR